MSTIDRHCSLDSGLADVSARVLADLQQLQAQPDLKTLARSVVSAWGQQPRICRVAFAINPALAALLDPGWAQERIASLVLDKKAAHPEWLVLNQIWPEGFSEDKMEWGSGVLPQGVPWPTSMLSGFQESNTGDWVRFQVQVEDCGVIVVALVFDGTLDSHPQWSQEVGQLKELLQLVCNLWAKIVALGDGMRQLSHEKQALSRLNRLQGRFVGMATHEFKTPLTSITAYADALQGMVDQEKLPHASEFLGVIRTEAGRLLRMVNRILDYSRMEFSTRLLGGSPQALGPLVEETVKTLGPTMAAKKLVCTLDFEEGIPFANVDADLIRQVLVNLIGNAVKFTPEGGNITIALAEAESSVEVRIADTGPGIPPQDIHRIFREFYRSRETANLQEGTGLGLTIVRHIINLHGGFVEARQRLGGGSVFTFWVPKEVHRLGSLPTEFTSLVGEEDARRLVAAVLQLVAEMAKVKTVALYLLDAQGMLVPVSSLGRKPFSSQVEGDVPDFQWHQLLDSERVRLIPEGPNSDSPLTMLAPVWSGGRPCGCLVVGRAAPGLKFQEPEMAQLEVLARIAGTVLLVLNSRGSETREISSSSLVTKGVEALRTLIQVGRRGVPTAAVDSLHLLGQLASQLGFGDQGTRDLKYAAALHDAGMARVEDEILLGETDLSYDERDEVDRHVEQGVDLMSPLLPGPQVAKMIRHHHERFDGSGYPEGLRGEEIPQGSRLLAVIDAWFSLTRGRPFRRGLSGEKALQEIRENVGTQFDAEVVGAFEKVLENEGCLKDGILKPGPAGLGI